MKMEAVGMAEEEDLRDLEAVEMVKETGDSGMIIGEILCLFAYIDFPLFLIPHVWWSQPEIYESGKGQLQVREEYTIYGGG